MILVYVAKPEFTRRCFQTKRGDHHIVIKQTTRRQVTDLKHIRGQRMQEVTAQNLQCNEITSAKMALATHRYTTLAKVSPSNFPAGRVRPDANRGTAQLPCP